MSMTMLHGGGRREEDEGRVRVSCSWTTRQLGYEGDNIPIYLGMYLGVLLCTM